MMMMMIIMIVVIIAIESTVTIVGRSRLTSSPSLMTVGVLLRS